MPDHPRLATYQPPAECFGGPFDGVTLAHHGEPWWCFDVSGVTSGHYRLSAISGVGGRDLGVMWFWRPGPLPVLAHKEVPGGR